MKIYLLKMKYIILIALTVFPFISQSVGINKTLKASVAHAILGGYVATLPKNLYQSINFGSFNTAGAFYATVINYDYSITPPPPSWITIMGSVGNVVSKEMLPQQVVRADCTLPIYLGSGTSYSRCPSFQVQVFVSNSLPGKLIISIGKQGYIVSTNVLTDKIYDYILDTNALIGTPHRWTLVGGSNTQSKIQSGFSNNNYRSSQSIFTQYFITDLTPLLYFRTDQTNKVTYVYSVTAK